MFTGIIAATGKIELIEARGADSRFSIDTGKLDLSDVGIGDSICVNGACLTVIELFKSGFVTDVSTETLNVTSLSGLTWGSQVNLEKALMLGDRLDGHMVSGHVDGVGVVSSLIEDARSIRFSFTAPEDLRRYICKKGSICIDGVSLTVNEVDGANFGVNIIPHTMQETIFSSYSTGSKVNLEVDLIARYLEGLQRERDS